MESTASTLLFLCATLGGVHRRRLHCVASCVHTEYFAHVRPVLQSVFSLKFKLLRFELVTLLDEIVQSLLAVDLDGSMGCHVTETLQDLTIKLEHNQLQVLLLQVPISNHLFQGLL